MKDFKSRRLEEQEIINSKKTARDRLARTVAEVSEEPSNPEALATPSQSDPAFRAPTATKELAIRPTRECARLEARTTRGVRSVCLQTPLAARFASAMMPMLAAALSRIKDRGEPDVQPCRSRHLRQLISPSLVRLHIDRPRRMHLSRRLPTLSKSR